MALFWNHFGRQNETMEYRRIDVRPLLSYIDENLDGDLTLASLAATLCVSVPHLKRLLRSLVGIPPHRYIVQRRVAYAAALLKEGRSSIREVALRAGFYDQSHMTRWMRRLAGVTPTVLCPRSSRSRPHP
jgi:AraC family transcriptional regulator